MEPLDTATLRKKLRETYNVPLVELDRPQTWKAATHSKVGCAIFVPNRLDPEGGEGHFTAYLKPKGKRRRAEYYDPLGKNSGLLDFKNRVLDGRDSARDYMTTNYNRPTQRKETHTCGDHVIERIAYKDSTFSDFKTVLLNTAKAELKAEIRDNESKLQNGSSC